jgi:D-threo-aldose 1-dehydrogenase
MLRLGKAGPLVPPIIFGTSALGNLYAAHPPERKLAVLREMFRDARWPVVLDSAGKYGAGLALETIGDGLRALGVQAEHVIISNKLGWLRVPLRGPEPGFEPGVWFGLDHDAEQAVSYEGILRCWEQGCALLGPPFRPALVSVHDPDELLARARTAAERDRAWHQLLEAYRALHELKQRGEVGFVGVGAKDWTVVRSLVTRSARLGDARLLVHDLPAPAGGRGLRRPAAERWHRRRQLRGVPCRFPDRGRFLRLPEGRPGERRRPAARRLA